MPFLENEPPAEAEATTTTTTSGADLFQSVGAAAEATDANKDEDRVVDQIESLCMNCHENGTTRLLLVSIPFFREVILMSFDCPHCHFKNSEVQAAGEIQPRGVKYTFQIEKPDDLQRQVVKSDSCTCKFPALELEIPAQRGQLTTVEGLLRGALEDLETDQEKRKDLDKENFYKIEAFLEKAKKMLEEDVDKGTYPWTLELDDPAGNSWVQPIIDDLRGKWTRTDYPRSREQNEALSLNPDEQPEQKQEISTLSAGDNVEINKDEVYSFPASCPTCTMHAVTNMKMVDIPHFQEVVIMSTVCDHCGYKSNEVKTGGAVPSRGRRITLKVSEPEDLARDILKSETCALSIPEIKLDLTPGTLGGRFTTLEGLLTQVYEELKGRIFDGDESDSMEPAEKARWEGFFGGLLAAKEGKIPYTVILEDPLAASYLQNLYAPDVDPNMITEDYDRTEEQNEDLGLNDIVTEGYEQEEKQDEEAKS
ncbi:nucleolar zinc-finger protein [Orbilia oligospora]|nr:nucleolar zinc-finger protein [Orbilia oligospora]KAF3269961.1 nucleolar zinc-finger protein [Orbilia oligospora]KAF3270423.1 nucleolar zinc-finger protein [Orbilia oligospora]KAF3298089.1 nucleolar zinc-finger protein [Orbilia oligospora]